MSDIKVEMPEQIRSQITQLEISGSRIAGMIDALRMVLRHINSAEEELIRRHNRDVDLNAVESVYYSISENAFYLRTKEVKDV